MNKMKWTLTTLAASLLIMTFASAADATVLRAFVSSTGADANTSTNCAQSAPCKTFNAAIAVVTAGGELIALDTSGYGPIANINKAITIATVPGATAFVVAATGTAGFTINGAAGDSITLRNINFNGSGAAGTTGLRHNSGQLIVDHCDFNQLTTGLRGLAGTIIARQSSFTNNSSRGVHVSGTAKVDLLDCLIANNVMGITADGNCASVFVRLDGGSVINNNLGFEMLNAVCAPNGGSLPQNIYLHNDGGFKVNVIGNTNTVGPLLGPGMQAVLGTYSTEYVTTF